LLDNPSHGQPEPKFGAWRVFSWAINIVGILMRQALTDLSGQATKTWENQRDDIDDQMLKKIDYRVYEYTSSSGSPNASPVLVFLERHRRQGPFMLLAPSAGEVSGSAKGPS
jgi:hypothetical protein